MLISEKYKLSGDENNITIEELKIIKTTDKETQITTSREEWKAVGYTSTIYGAIKFISKREISLSLSGEVNDVLDKIKELSNSLEDIAAKIIKKAEVKIIEQKKKTKNIKKEENIEDWELQMIEEEEEEEENKTYESWS